MVQIFGPASVLPPEESSGYVAAFAPLLLCILVLSCHCRDLTGLLSVAEIPPGELPEQSGQERGSEESEEHL